MAAAVDWVRDAFGHLKFIGRVPEAAALFEGKQHAGVVVVVVVAVAVAAAPACARAAGLRHSAPHLPLDAASGSG